MPKQVLEALEVEPQEGLSHDQIAERRGRFGTNRIRQSRRRSVLRIWIAQCRSVVVAILFAAAVLAFAFGKVTEGIAILAVILVNCLIGFISEWRAARSMEALRKMGKRRVRVRRDGEEREIPATSLVPGDICLHEGGDMLSADLRLIEANNLQVDESTLTGESISVAKQVDPVDADSRLPDRAGMLYRGTTITQGSAVGVVVATGMKTELGHIAEMTEEAQGDEHTPLEHRLNRLGQRLAWVALGAAAVVGAAGLLAGKPTLLMIETAIALGVAAIPEGLPFVATIGLARGMWLMARKQALINRLPAVETLGTTNVILSDKTGTLTENRMVAAVLAIPAGNYDLRQDMAGSGSPPPDKAGQGRPASEHDPSDALFSRCLEIGVLCNNASASDRDGDGAIDETRGDPTEIALLTGAAQWGIDREELLKNKPEVREEAFDPETMMMATIHALSGRFLYAVKGAPKAVIERCRSLAGAQQEPMTAARRETWNSKARDLAEQGLRVLAFADKEADASDANPYEDIRFVGLIGLLDPPRDNIRRSLEACRRAGIRVVMVTGDQPETAGAIAADFGLVDKEDATVLTGNDLGDVDTLSAEQKERILEAHVFARMSPEQKLQLLTLFQERGDTVAMTGDGVNDAPALKKADIGVAMGKRGTDAARESADMVLKNDAFASILAAVQQGRVIFSNIRKSVIFMLCTNVAEVAAVGIASLLDWPLPIRPLQILFLNVITDVLPALALSAGKGDPEKTMQRPPRDSGESVLGRRQWLAVSGWSAVISVCVLGALMVAVHLLQFPVAQAVTISFLTLAFAKLWFVLNLREPDSGILRNDVVGNPWMWAALSVCTLLLIAAVYALGLSSVLETERPGFSGWTTILALSALPALTGQIRLAVNESRSRHLNHGTAQQ
jgi:P-type Ca2+ transporter type 2C